MILPRWLSSGAAALWWAAALCTPQQHAVGQGGAVPARPQGVESWPTDELSAQLFTARDGLSQTSVYFLRQTPDGTIWAGHDEGVSHYTGPRWSRFTIGGNGGVRQVRDMWMQDDGTLWFATRNGVVRQHNGVWTNFDRATGGPSEAVVYAILESKAFDTPSIIVGTASGIARFDGTRFVPVPLPIGFRLIGTTLAETRDPDGTYVLWLGGANGGLARYSRGTWQVQTKANGFTTTSVEQLVVPPPSADAELYSVGDAGMHALRQGQWRLVPSGASGAIYRALALQRADGGTELWVASRSGGLRRRRTNGVWEGVSPGDQSISAPVISLTAIPSPTGEPMVWVGYRGDRVARYALGPAAELVLPPSLDLRSVRALRETQDAEGRPELWIGLVSGGIARWDGRTLRRYSDADGLPSLTVLNIVERGRGASRELWVGTTRGPALLRGSRWVPATRGIPNDLSTLVIPGHAPDGAPTLLLQSDAGLHWQHGDSWEAYPGMEGRSVSAVAEVSAAGAATLWVATNEGIFKHRAGQGWQRDTASLEEPIVRSLDVVPARDGSITLWALGNGVIFWRRVDDPRWHSITPVSHPGVPVGLYTSLTHDRDGRIYVAGPRGVARLAVAAPDSVALETNYAAEDGLPSSDAQTLAMSPSAPIVWVATVRGVGLLRATDTPRIATPAQLSLLALVLPARKLLFNNSAIDGTIGAVSLALSLQSFHRESDSRYRVTLNGALVGSEWSDQSDFVLGALKPGPYKVEAWGRDWRGTVSGPRQLSFRVKPPWYLTTAAIVFWFAAAAGALALAFELRSRALRQRAAMLEDNERRLRASEQKFRSIFDRAQDANLLFDGLNLVGANAKALELYRAASDGALADAHGLSPLLVEASPAADEPPAEMQLRVGDGTVVPVLVSRTSIPLEHRVLTHVVMRDLSAEKQAEASAAQLEMQLREAQKLESLGTLAGGVAHDFNNLLAVIRGNAELASDQVQAGVTPGEEIEQIIRASDRARDLVRQILTFSRRTRARRERVDLSLLVREMTSLLRATFPTTVDLRVVAPTSGLLVVGDPSQLQQAILNLCTNAEHALRSKNGGTLTVVVERAAPESATPGAWIRVMISDTGEGMRREIRERIFEPFFTTKPVGEGTGLGLAVLHGIVLSHEGRVRVESTVGVGTQVELLFPEAPQGTSASPAPLPLSLSAAPRGNGARVVVVDDEPSVLDVTTRIVTSLGYLAQPFASPRAALAYVRDQANPVDLLLSDQTMPGMTGDELLEEARRVRPGLPVVLMTGFSYRLTDDKRAALGHVTVLIKPVPLMDLAVTLQREIAGPQQSGSVARV